MAQTLAPSDDWQDMHWFYRGVKRHLGAGIRGALRIRHRGTDHVPTEGPLIVTVNHQSWFDPIAVCAVFPRPLWHFAKEKLFSNPVKARFFLAMGQIPVDRFGGDNTESVAQGKRLLDEGKSLGVYPEGTRSRDGRVLKFRPGVGRIALETRVPVVPVGILVRHFFRKGALLPRFGTPVYVNIGPPMTFDKLYPAEGKPDAAAVADCVELIRGNIADLVRECEVAYEEEQRWEN